MAKRRPLDDRLNRLAKYEGMLARWGDLTGNIPDTDVKNKAEWFMGKFSSWVNDRIKEKRDEKV